MRGLIPAAKQAVTESEQKRGVGTDTELRFVDIYHYIHIYWTISVKFLGQFAFYFQKEIKKETKLAGIKLIGDSVDNIFWK